MDCNYVVAYSIFIFDVIFKNLQTTLQSKGEMAIFQGYFSIAEASFSAYSLAL